MLQKLNAQMRADFDLYLLCSSIIAESSTLSSLDEAETNAQAVGFIFLGYVQRCNSK